MTAWPSVLKVIILAGGASRRMGTDKLRLRRSGTPLLDTVVTGVRRQASRHASTPTICIVGPRPLAAAGLAGPDVVFTREHPPGSGPLAALGAGLACITDRIGGSIDADRATDAEQVVIVLAGDAPRGPEAIPHLLDAVTNEREDSKTDGAVLIDPDGRRQPLCAAYVLAPLQATLADIGDTTGRRMDKLIDRLALTPVTDTVGAADDIDTPEDAQRLGFIEN